MDELEQLIAKIPQPLPGETLDRRIGALLAQAQPLPAPRRKRGLLWVALASAAAVAVALSLHLLNPEASWAEMAAAVQSKPWIHLKAAGDAPNSREIWLSFSLDVEAMRSQDGIDSMARFADYRTGVKLEYDPATKRLYRLPLLDHEADSFQSQSSIFRPIFRGEMPSGEQFAGLRIIGRKERMVEEGEQKWQEYELEVQGGGQAEPMSVVIRAAPDTKLPASLSLLQAGKVVVRFDCDYPAEGPADIYALGVPRDLPIEDRLPAADLAQIIRCLDDCRRDLDHYFAVTVGGGVGGELVWRSGERWRVELLMPSPHPKSIPADSAEREAWFREHLPGWCASADPIIVCNGRDVYRCGYGAVGLTWKVLRTARPGEGHRAARAQQNSSRAMIEFAAFPQLVASAQTKLTVDPAGPGGPAGSTLVEISHGFKGNATLDDRTYHTERYWLDPARNYVALKSEISNCPEVDRDPARVHKDETYEFEEFRQSPRGIWYPTVVRHKHASGEEDQAAYFYLDFAAPLPDELFTPGARRAGM